MYKLETKNHMSCASHPQLTNSKTLCTDVTILCLRYSFSDRSLRIGCGAHFKLIPCDRGRRCLPLSEWQRPPSPGRRSERAEASQWAAGAVGVDCGVCLPLREQCCSSLKTERVVGSGCKYYTYHVVRALRRYLESAALRLGELAASR